MTTGISPLVRTAAGSRRDGRGARRTQRLAIGAWCGESLREQLRDLRARHALFRPGHSLGRPGVGCRVDGLSRHHHDAGFSAGPDGDRCRRPVARRAGDVVRALQAGGAAASAQRQGRRRHRQHHRHLPPALRARGGAAGAAIRLRPLRGCRAQEGCPSMAGSPLRSSDHASAERHQIRRRGAAMRAAPALPRAAHSLAVCRCLRRPRLGEPQFAQKPCRRRAPLSCRLHVGLGVPVSSRKLEAGTGTDTR